MRGWVKRVGAASSRNGSRWLITVSVLVAAVEALAAVAPAQRPGPLARQLQLVFDELETRSGSMLREGGVDWPRLRAEMEEDAMTVRTPEDQRRVLDRLVRVYQRLRTPSSCRFQMYLEGGFANSWPGAPNYRLSGHYRAECRVWSDGETVLVKSAWGSALRAGLRPGMEVVAIQGKPALEWLQGRARVIRRNTGSRRNPEPPIRTTRFALYLACTSGLSLPRGSALVLNFGVLDFDGRRFTARLPCESRDAAPSDRERESHGQAEGMSYIRPDCLDVSTLECVDRALAELPPAGGLILDLRACPGAIDELEMAGRFVARGATLERRGLPDVIGGGPNPYGGPLVVLVDAGTWGSSELVAFLLQQHGRATVIGDGETAGAALNWHRRVELESGLSVTYPHRSFPLPFPAGASHVVPDVVVAYDATDLRHGRDTLYRRAVDRLLGREPAAESTDVPQGTPLSSALVAVEELAGPVLRERGVDWRRLCAELVRHTRKQATPQNVATALLALRDGIRDPECQIYDPRGGEIHADGTSPSFLIPGHASTNCRLCLVGRKVLVLDPGAGYDCGLRRGSEVVKIDGLVALHWLRRRAGQFQSQWHVARDAAFYFACRYGLSTRKGWHIPVVAANQQGRLVEMKLPCKYEQVSDHARSDLYPGTRRQRKENAWHVRQGSLDYVRMIHLDVMTPERLLNELLAESPSINGLVLDLRGSGGATDEMEALRCFAGPGAPLTLGGLPVVYGLGPKAYGGPMVVLVDGGTRGSAERLAYLLQRYGRARIMGEGRPAAAAFWHRRVEVQPGFRFLFSHRISPIPAPPSRSAGVAPDAITPYQADALRRKMDSPSIRAFKWLKRRVRSIQGVPGWTGPR